MIGVFIGWCDPGDVRERSGCDIGEELRRRIDHVGRPIRTIVDRAVGLVRRPDSAVAVDRTRIEMPADAGGVGFATDRRVVETCKDARSVRALCRKPLDRVGGTPFAAPSGLR